MAKWEVGVNKTEDRFFFSMFDKVHYLVPLEREHEWAAWSCSNESDVPEYATPCPGPQNMTFTAPWQR